MASHIYLSNTSAIPSSEALLLKVSEVAGARFMEVFALLVKTAALTISRLLCVSPRGGVLLVKIVESAASLIDGPLCSLFRGELVKKGVEFYRAIESTISTYGP
jgi:hypothetical protein